MDLTLANFVLYGVLGTFAVVTVLALISRTLHARVEKRALANRVICRLCLHAFEESSHVRTINCPICSTTNEKGRSRKLG